MFVIPKRSLGYANSACNWKAAPRLTLWSWYIATHCPKNNLNIEILKIYYFFCWICTFARAVCARPWKYGENLHNRSSSVVAKLILQKARYHRHQHHFAEVTASVNTYVTMCLAKVYRPFCLWRKCANFTSVDCVIELVMFTRSMILLPVLLTTHSRKMNLHTKCRAYDLIDINFGPSFRLFQCVVVRIRRTRVYMCMVHILVYTYII